jgi:hypothetical protein
MDLGYIPVLVTDACGSRDNQAANRALAGLHCTGGSYQIDVATIGRLMRGAGVTRSRAQKQKQ